MARKSIESIRNEIKEIAKEKQQIQDACSVLRDQYGITNNNIRNRSVSLKIPQEIWQIRDKYVNQIKEYDNRLTELKREFQEMHIKIDIEKNIALMGVFAEIFNDAQRKEIMIEIDRRRSGESPMPLGIDFKELQRYKDGYYQYRSIAQEQLNKMIEFRTQLTLLIEDGCKRFGNADFLKFISPLNKLIIPVSDLIKIKIRNSL